jgi:predicted CoA-binding protein
VAEYLKAMGYSIIPVNPTVDEVRGANAYNSLSDIPDAVKRELDVVDIFRRSENLPPVIEEAVQIHKQLGQPTAEVATQKARASSMDGVTDRCMMIEPAARKPLTRRGSHSLIS